jgi:hypothetical protein
MGAQQKLERLPLAESISGDRGDRISAMPCTSNRFRRFSLCMLKALGLSFKGVA